MIFANAISRCDDIGVKNQIRRIEQYKEYTLLCEMTIGEYKSFRDMFKNIPLQVRSWYKFANGGKLFDTQFLSTQSVDLRSGVRLQRLSIYNSVAAREMSGLPEKYVAFAIASFGDFYCFSQDGEAEIIQWSVTDHKILGKWSNFYLWLKQEIDISIELVMSDYLFPMGVYNKGAHNEQL